MEHNYEDIVLMERYLERSLTEKEKAEVEKRLSEEPSLRELYRQEQLLVRGIQFAHLKTKLDGLRELEASLPAVKAEEDAARIIDIKSYWKVMAVAASIGIALGIYLIINRPVEPSELYAQNFKPYPNVFEPVVRGTIEQNLRAEAFAAYERGDYNGASTSFKELLKTKEEPGILLLLGNANLILGKTSEAKENFVTLSKDFGKVDRQIDRQAKWYLSLCYLKMKNKDAARLLLEEIAGEESSYQGKAKALLKKLD